MTTRHERIKNAVVRLQLPITLNARTHESVIQSYERWLEGFLADKSLTGARIADLGYVEFNTYLNGDPLTVMNGKNTRSVNPDPDEAIAELWREVFIDEVPE